MFPTTANSSKAAERRLSWMATQLYSDVVFCSTRARQAARHSVAILQTTRAGLGLETKRSPLGTHLPVDTYS